MSIAYAAFFGGVGYKGRKTREKEEGKASVLLRNPPPSFSLPILPSKGFPRKLLLILFLFYMIFKTHFFFKIGEIAVFTNISTCILNSYKLPMVLPMLVESCIYRQRTLYISVYQRFTIGDASARQLPFVCF